MGEVDAGHEVIPVSDGGEAFRSGGAVNGDVFANHVSSAKADSAGGGGIEREVLRVGAEDGPVADPVVGPHLDRSVDPDLCPDLAPRPDHGGAVDDGEGADRDIVGESGLRRDLGGGMNGGHGESLGELEGSSMVEWRVKARGARTYAKATGGRGQGRAGAPRPTNNGGIRDPGPKSIPPRRSRVLQANRTHSGEENRQSG